ncbi:striatin-4-like [Coturnix japonica]|uniref:striatin-4-like n=1 Tax=Coturnix japonica TaxID=93934 RepID=UPI0007771DA0|nr:striatin-4-like [Coturnix japonica]
MAANDDDDEDEDDDDDDDDSEDALNEFDFLGSGQNNGRNRGQSGDRGAVSMGLHGLPDLRDVDGIAATGGRQGNKPHRDPIDTAPLRT